MKHFFLLLILFSLGLVPCVARESADTILIHRGEVVYARFTQKGLKLKLVSATTVKDELAQVILTLDQAEPAKKSTVTFKIVNKFKKDLLYKAEMRVLKEAFNSPTRDFRVVAEKLAFEEVPDAVEEFVLKDFELEK